MARMSAPSTGGLANMRARARAERAERAAAQANAANNATIAAGAGRSGGMRLQSGNTQPAAVQPAAAEEPAMNDEEAIDDGPRPFKLTRSDARNAHRRKNTTTDDHILFYSRFNAIRIAKIKALPGAPIATKHTKILDDGTEVSNNYRDVWLFASEQVVRDWKFENKQVKDLDSEREYEAAKELNNNILDQLKEVGPKDSFSEADTEETTKRALARRLKYKKNRRQPGPQTFPDEVRADNASDSGAEGDGKDDVQPWESISVKSSEARDACDDAEYRMVARGVERTRRRLADEVVDGERATKRRRI